MDLMSRTSMGLFDMLEHKRQSCLFMAQAFSTAKDSTIEPQDLSNGVELPPHAFFLRSAVDVVISGQQHGKVLMARRPMLRYGSCESAISLIT